MTPSEIPSLSPHRTQLDNGLRVWVKPRPGTGTVILLLQVPVGSRHETKANNGISHFLEHLLFTGTAKWDEKQVTEVIRRRGGEANARTAAEDTLYWLHLKAEDLDLGLEWLAEVVFRATLPPEKFEKERQIIIEEKGGEIGVLKTLGEWIEDAGLGWNIFRAVRHRLFPKDALLLPIIGEDASLRRLTHEDIKAFYQQHYAPNNMTLIVVGDVVHEDVVARAQTHFAHFPARDVPTKPSTPPPPLGGFNLRLRGPSLNNQGQLLLGAPLPGLGHSDRWALAVLAEILDTQLTEEIRFKRGLVYGIDIYPAMYSDIGYFVIYTSADSSKFPEILAEVEAHLARAVRGELDPKKVAEARAALRGRLLLGLESNPDFGWWLAEMSLITPEGQPLPDLFAEVDAVTPEAVTRVAETYLAPDKRYLAQHRPGATPASLAVPTAVVLGTVLSGLGLWLWRRNQRGKH